MWHLFSISWTFFSGHLFLLETSPQACLLLVLERDLWGKRMDTVDTCEASGAWLKICSVLASGLWGFCTFWLFGCNSNSQALLKETQKTAENSCILSVTELDFRISFSFPHFCVGNIVQRLPAIVSVVSPLLASEILLDLWFVQKICKVHYSSWLDHPGVDWSVMIVITVSSKRFTC